MVNKSKIKSVVFMPADHHGCGYYRTFLPAVSLCRLGIPANILSQDRVHLYSLANTLVIQRPTDPGIESLIDEAHGHGMKVVFELDDNLWDIPKWNQAYPFWTHMRLETTKKLLSKCDLATTTTPYLANKLKQWNDNVLVVPNAIFNHNYVEMPKQIKYDTEIVIGWVGSSFHHKDTAIFKTLIPTILETYSNVGFLMMGESPPKELAGYSNRIITLPFVEAIYYHTVLTSFQMNIGLAPLVINEFNKSKSPIKLIEYLYTNTFPICSEIEPYMSIKNENPDSCMLIPTNEDTAGTVDDWMNAIDYCVKNKEIIRQRAEQGKQFVLENYNIETDKMRKLYKQGYYLED
jgi:glycosyltransferase involved in cell wall biosynthesis